MPLSTPPSLMWSYAIFLVLAFVLPVAAFVPALQTPKNAVVRQAKKAHVVVMSCCGSPACECGPSGSVAAREAVRSRLDAAFLFDGDAPVVAQRCKPKKKNGCCPCCPNGCECCSTGCSCLGP